MAECNMAEFKMAAIINLSENEWVKFFLYKMAEYKIADIKISARSSWVRMDEWSFFVQMLREDNKVLAIVMCSLRERTKMAEFKMAAIIKLSQNEQVKFFFCANGWIQDGRIQDGCHHQVESEWMTLSQIELDWVRVLCNMAESKMAEFKMAAII